MRMVHKKYRKRIRASCKLSKGMDWTDVQLKRIEGGHQDVWGHNHEIIRVKQNCTLMDDHTYFEMRWIATRTGQLIHIAKATGSKIYTRESEAQTQGLPKALVLSLKQFHAHYYRLYEKGTTRAMVGLQGLHSSDAFWHLNMLASVGPKSFSPWCLKLGGNTEITATHLREVDYRLAIMCNFCNHSPTCQCRWSWNTNQSAGQSHTRSLSWGSEKKLPKANSGESWWLQQTMPENFHPRLLMMHGSV